MQYMDELIVFLKDKGVEYNILNEYCLYIEYSGENHPVTVLALFDEDGGNTVKFSTANYLEVPQNSLISTLITCNRFNKHYRWVRFAVGGDKQVAIDRDEVIEDDSSVGDMCYSYMKLIADIANEVYSDFMQSFNK